MTKELIGLNPLKVNDDSFYEEVKKRELRNIIKSYAGYYDSFSELIQNAMDAVDKRKEENGSEKYIKKIWIKIDLLNNSVSVTDNGVGFNEGEINFFAPNISYKGMGKRGKKGVGASYLAYGFNYIQVGSKNSKVNFLVELKDGNKWVDSEGAYEAPIFEESNLIHDIYNNIDRGTTFTIKYGGSSTRPKKLDWLGATSALQWMRIFTSKTPLGQIDLFKTLKDEERIQYSLEVVDYSGTSTYVGKEEIEYASYLYPHLVIDKSKDYKEIVEARAKHFNKGKDLTSLNKEYKKLNGMYIYATSDDLKSDMHFTSTELSAIISEDTSESLINFIEKYNVNAYGFFGYSRQLWDDYNHDELKIRRNVEILTHGIQIATDRMPQGSLISIPLNFETGYQYQTHVVVHFDDAEPDLGRKGFQPEITEVSKRIGEKMLKQLRRFKKDHLRDSNGGNVELLSEESIQKWIDKQREHEIKNPLEIKKGL